jgi:hypothetical protein
MCWMSALVCFGLLTKACFPPQLEALTQSRERQQADLTAARDSLEADRQALAEERQAMKDTHRWVQRVVAATCLVQRDSLGSRVKGRAHTHRILSIALSMHH